MKKVLSAILVLAILICSLAAIPVSAETESVSNMTWTVLRGTWNKGTDAITCTSASGNRFVFSSEKTARTDNWSVSYDVKKTATSEDVAIAAGGQDFYFGRVETAFSTSKAFMYVTITTDSKMGLFYNAGGQPSNTKIGSWRNLPSGTDLNSYNIKISVINLMFYCYINDTLVAVYDISNSDYNYSGGYFGLIPSVSDTFTTTYSNYHFSVNNEPISISGGYFIPYDNGFKTVNSVQKWNTAFIGNSAVGKYSEINLDYSYISGNDQGYVRFGDVSTSDYTDYYELRLEVPTDTARNFAVYHITTDGNTKLASKSLTTDVLTDLRAFGVKVKLTPLNCKVYIDNILIIDTAVGYNGGKFALQALYTVALFDNIVINNDIAYNTPKLTAGRVTVANADGSMTTSGAEKAWSRIIVENVDTSDDFEITYDIVHTSGNYFWNMYFGVTTTDVENITDGYYLTINYSDNDIADDVIVNNVVTDDRASARFAFPSTSNLDAFRVTLKYVNNVFRFYIDGTFVGTTTEITMPGSNCFIRVRQCESTISLVDVNKPSGTIGDINFDNTFDAGDLARFRQYILGTNPNIDKALADYNADKDIDIKDLVRAKKILAGDMSAIAGYTAATAENNGYQYIGDFEPMNAGSGFSVNAPYLYMVNYGTDVGYNGCCYETKMGIYMTNDYSVSEVGYILADGDQTLNTEAMVIGSDTLNITTAAFADVKDFAEYRIFVEGLENNTAKTVRAYAKVTDANGTESFIYSSECCFFQ